MAKYNLLEKFGIELEYMVVDKKTLDIKPIVDKIIEKEAGKITQEVERLRVNWSNELSLHVIEVKNKDPEASIEKLLPHFEAEVHAIEALVDQEGCQLLPGAVHPWMDPMSEAKLWPHSNRVIYDTYDRIFGCKGHGWSNLQSMHINISFNGDDEFRKLNSAIRMVLPLIPALCSSSPIIDGRISEYSSSRLFHYLKNQRKIPSIIGDVIPEAVISIQQYKSIVLQKMYDDIAKDDPDKILQHEWLNSRGAIPKFKYGCIEIRLADIQECPKKDLATAEFFIQIIKKLTESGIADQIASEKIHESELKQILIACAVSAEDAVIDNEEYLRIFGIQKPVTAKELLQHLYEKLKFNTKDSHYGFAIQHSLEKGSLSHRLLKKLGKEPTHDELLIVYNELANCLREGRFFEA